MSGFKTILLAEDNPKDVELTLEALSEFNLANQVVAVKDGVEVMEYLQYKGKYQNRVQENPAVILLDIKMPRMDGIEVLNAIRNDPALKRLPVVMLTSSKEEPDLKRCYELGANAYVVKPVDFTDFIEAVKQVGVFWAVINELPPESV
ncbi:MAG: response regulator [Ignavibacteriales bacterium]|nr:MAG: response regulator [Ignavibacteriales bacterium]